MSKVTTKKWKFMKLNGKMIRKYMVSSTGDIVLTSTKKPLKTSRMYKKNSTNGTDYLSVQINGEKVRAHRIVCETFNGPAPRGRNLVNHVDERKNNNTAKNLAWVSPSENMLAYYSKHAHSFYSRKTISTVKRLINKNWTNDSIATEVKMSDSNVSAIRLGLLHVAVTPYTKYQFG